LLLMAKSCQKMQASPDGQVPAGVVTPPVPVT
jgi:hypothetical protein